ncbi:hypothetical protein ACG83_38935 [Frankia sp. R43]|nr:hypothetical protein ACG83_38935 [Frankia sp. R43]
MVRVVDDEEYRRRGAGADQVRAPGVGDVPQRTVDVPGVGLPVGQGGRDGRAQRGAGRFTVTGKQLTDYSEGKSALTVCPVGREDAEAAGLGLAGEARGQNGFSVAGRALDDRDPDRRVPVEREQCAESGVLAVSFDQCVSGCQVVVGGVRSGHSSVVLLHQCAFRG